MKIKRIEDYAYDKENGESIALDDVSMTYIDEGDCEKEDREEPNTITISAVNNGCARYIVLQTERWAISDIDDIIDLLNDFKNRAMLNKE